ncbi:fungal-specific transcription factor domain-containing protein [Auriculariales sp. MPI-PUGE-AT-0066]|nr:fungal-specific transcription factor domain-containing protein [Auriculariales sp. MPI-PUGE-AT-0066]
MNLRFPKCLYIDAFGARTVNVQGVLQQLEPHTDLMRNLGVLAMPSIPYITLPPELVERKLELNFQSALAPTTGLLDNFNIQQIEDLQSSFSLPEHNGPFRCFKRPEYWHAPHEFRGEQLEDRAFNPQLPSPDRLAFLVRNYFETFNIVYPIFHRDLFERQLLDQAFIRDAHFMAVVLLVCALAEGQLAADITLDSGGPVSFSTPSPWKHTKSKPAGLEYFTQVEPFLRVPTPIKPRFLDVQIFLLAGVYIGLVLGSSTCWFQLDTAFRMAIQRHDHRRRQTVVPNLMDELKIRTFWSLIIADRRTASIYGRPVCIKDHMFDLELPLEVDEARWDLSTVGFPLNETPITEFCTSGFFAWQVRLSTIQGFIMQTIYSINRSRTMLGFVGADWERQTIRRLDGFLKDWVTNVPKSLSWHPDIPNLEVFLQSSILYTNYHCLVIMAHNPFMRTTARNFSRASREGITGVDLAAALSICTEAALQCSDMLVLLVDRLPWAFGLAGLADPAFVSGLVLLVNLYGFRSGLTEFNRQRFTSAAEVCLKALKLSSMRFRMLGKLCDLLQQLFTDLDDELVIPSPLPSSPSICFNSSTLPSTLTTSSAGMSDDVIQHHDTFNIELLPTGLRRQMADGLRQDVPLDPLPQSWAAHESALGHIRE